MARRAETMVQLTDELVELLDSEARRRGVSRSALVREAVTTYLTESTEAVMTRRIIEGYTRRPQLTPDTWGTLDADVDRSAREVHERLSVEERAAGAKEW